MCAFLGKSWNSALRKKNALRIMSALCRRNLTLVLAMQTRGDHYVTMKVTIPKDISADERKLLQELQGKGDGKAGGKAKDGKKAKGSKVRNSQQVGQIAP